jgi:hypothetical protein
MDWKQHTEHGEERDEWTTPHTSMTSVDEKLLMATTFVPEIHFIEEHVAKQSIIIQMGPPSMYFYVTLYISSVTMDVWENNNLDNTRLR